VQAWKQGFKQQQKSFTADDAVISPAIAPFRHSPEDGTDLQVAALPQLNHWLNDRALTLFTGRAVRAVAAVNF
jgi:hypothetical protein